MIFAISARKAKRVTDCAIITAAHVAKLCLADTCHVVAADGPLDRSVALWTATRANVAHPPIQTGVLLRFAARPLAVRGPVALAT